MHSDYLVQGIESVNEHSVWFHLQSFLYVDKKELRNRVEKNERSLKLGGLRKTVVQLNRQLHHQSK